MGARSSVGSWLLVLACCGAAYGQEVPAESSNTTPSTTIPLRVTVTGTRDCPSEGSFVEAVLERTDSARRAERGEEAWSVEVFVEPKSRARLAQLVMRSADGPWIQREVLAPNCRQALDALALVVAILVETAAEQAALLEAAQKKGQLSKQTRAVAPLPTVAAGAWVPWIDDPYYFEKRGVHPVGTEHFIVGYFGMEADQSLIPVTVPQLRLGGEWSRWDPEVLNPAVGVYLSWTAGEVLKKQTALLGLTRFMLGVELCPVDLLTSTSLELRPCLRADAGVVESTVERANQGPDIPTRSRSATVAMLGPTLRFAVGGGSRFSLRADLGLSTYAKRDDYWVEVDGEETLLSRPAVTNGRVGFGFAVRF